MIDSKVHYKPFLKPIIEENNTFSVDIFYENKFWLMEDIGHDEDHIHDLYELYINLSGDVSFLVDGNLYPIARGDVVISCPNDVHRCIYHSDCVHEHFCIWFKDFPLAQENLEAKFREIKLVSLPDEQKEQLIEYCFNAYKNLSKEDPLIGFRIIHEIYGIFDLVCSTASESFSVQAQSLPESFSCIIDYINQNYGDSNCTVSNICEKFYISKSTLCRRFRRYFQTTPSDYLESKRLSESKRMLLAGHSVQNVCLNCGFSDCSYFIMRFRMKFGISPYKYKKSIW